MALKLSDSGLRSTKQLSRWYISGCQEMVCFYNTAMDNCFAIPESDVDNVLINHVHTSTTVMDCSDSTIHLLSDFSTAICLKHCLHFFPAVSGCRRMSAKPNNATAPHTVRTDRDRYYGRVRHNLTGLFVLPSGCRFTRGLFVQRLQVDVLVPRKARF